MGTLKGEPGRGVCEACLGTGPRWCLTYSQRPLPAAGGGGGGQTEEVGSGVSSPRSGPGVQTQVPWSTTCQAASGEKCSHPIPGVVCPHFPGEDVAP